MENTGLEYDEANRRYGKTTRPGEQPRRNFTRSRRFSGTAISSVICQYRIFSAAVSRRYTRTVLAAASALHTATVGTND